MNEEEHMVISATTKVFRDRTKFPFREVEITFASVTAIHPTTVGWIASSVYNNKNSKQKQTILLLRWHVKKILPLKWYK